MESRAMDEHRLPISDLSRNTIHWALERSDYGG
mgnify:CR=1 FL=1